MRVITFDMDERGLFVQALGLIDHYSQTIFMYKIVKSCLIITSG